MTDTETTTIDRPGELLRVGYDIASDIAKGDLVTLTDPRDGTKAPAVLANGVATVVNPDRFDPYRAVPVARKGTSRLTRLDAFIALTNRFKDTNSAVFADDSATAPKVTTVFDYHPEGPSDARNGKHRAEYAFPLSDEWKAWHAANGKQLSMSEFASFLEDHIVDVVADAAPSSEAAQDFVAKTGGNIASPSNLIEIARTLQINETSTLREARNLSNGTAEVVFQSDHLDAAGRKLVLPNLFMICVPVFARSPVFYQLLARFRYRKAGASIVFWFDLWRDDLVFEQAFSEACAKVVEKTGLPMFEGAPEA